MSDLLKSLSQNRGGVALHSPVLVVDGLGVSAQIRAADISGLTSLANRLDAQYNHALRFIPKTVLIRLGSAEFSSKEFSTIRLNDMFIMFSEEPGEHLALRYVFTALVVYLHLIASACLPRGGLGYGPILRRKDMILGQGFLDAYDAAEKRDPDTRDVCAVQVSPDFLRKIGESKSIRGILCRYRTQTFLNPLSLVDPDLGQLDVARILEMLEAAGCDQIKLDATADFLETQEKFGDSSRVRVAGLSPDDAVEQGAPGDAPTASRLGRT